MIGVVEAADALAIHPSRVRSLIAAGLLEGEKISGRWMLQQESVEARRRGPVPSGRPLAPRNAWALLLEASGDDASKRVDPVADWRMRQSLANNGLLALRGRLERRAQAHSLWGLRGELGALRSDQQTVLTGSSAAGDLKLGLAAPDTIDAYVTSSRLDGLMDEYGLQDAPAEQANVVLRAVPDDAWMIEGRGVAPAAAVALDLASYSDSRSNRVGMQMLRWLEHGRPAR
jgi:hypothetical protein